MAIQNLSNQYISQSYQSLVQVSSSGLLYDGTGNIISKVTATLIPTTSSIAVTGSLYFDINSNKLYIHNGTVWKSASLS
jgi:hypothetical protein